MNAGIITFRDDWTPEQLEQFRSAWEGALCRDVALTSLLRAWDATWTTVDCDTPKYALPPADPALMGTEYRGPLRPDPGRTDRWETWPAIDGSLVVFLAALAVIALITVGAFLGAFR